MEQHLKDDIIEEVLKNTKVNQLNVSNVKSKVFDMNKSVLQFQDDKDRLTNICNIDNLDDGMHKIKKIFKGTNLEHRLHYFRVVEHDDYYWIDYGSHYTFFRITKKG